MFAATPDLGLEAAVPEKAIKLHGKHGCIAPLVIRYAIVIVRIGLS
jgi:hypothetical protein